MTRPTILCPVDFSDASRGALRYAAALAEHFFATLALLAVDDPFLVNAVDAALGEGYLQAQTRQELEQLTHSTFPGQRPQVAELRFLHATGSPADEITRVSKEIHADAIVMSTHGASGIRKLIFGSTTERVLREAELPVIVTPASDPGPESVEDWQRSATTLLVPVDMSEYTPRQLQIARGLAESLQASLVLAHVLEPLPHRRGHDTFVANAEAARREKVHGQLEALAATLPTGLSHRLAIAVGDPASELARIAKEQNASGIVMGLHASSSTGQRMGTVTYRLLCQTPVLVIAWPPARNDSPLIRPTGSRGQRLAGT